jgi:hypothetical protein
MRCTIKPKLPKSNKRKIGRAKEEGSIARPEV